MRLRTAAAGTALIAIAVTGCSALAPEAVTSTITHTITSVATTTMTAVSTAVSTALSTVVETVTGTATSTETTTVTPVMDIPGPEDGPACPAAPDYYDEEPDGLNPKAVKALLAAKSAAADKGITLCVNDGKRSRTQQQEIYDDYLRRYGEQTADELVLPPDKSSHVTGFAIDVQPAAAYRWLQATAGSFGWCRIYDNEPWHFEYRAKYTTGGCPDRLPEPVR